MRRNGTKTTMVMNGYVLRAVTYHMPSALAAQREAEMLVAESRWFMVTPMPDDTFEFTVKDE